MPVPDSVSEEKRDSTNWRNISVSLILKSMRAMTAWQQVASNKVRTEQTLALRFGKIALGMRLSVFLSISLLAWSAQPALGQCSHPNLPTQEQRELENRSVLLNVRLNKRGGVRDATVIRGAQALRAPAIKAAKSRKYKHRVVYSFPDPHEMMVQVTFPKDRKGPPDVRQALPGGASSCVPLGQLQIAGSIVPTWLNLVLKVQPIMPVLAHQATE
jgi:hypothetical protein